MKLLSLIIIACLIPIALCSRVFASTKKVPIAIMGAMDIEIDLLQKTLKNREVHTIAGMSFYTGILGNKEVVIALSGIGKVNATIASTILFEHFNAREIIFTGVAGALDSSLHVGDIIVATDLIQHDFDLSIFGEKLGKIDGIDRWAIETDTQRSELLASIAKNIYKTNTVYMGRILSGDQFINSKEKSMWLNSYFENAKAVEMEGAAVALVAYKYKKPFVIIRAISDTPYHDEKQSKDQYETFARNVAEISARVVQEYIDKLE